MSSPGRLRSRRAAGRAAGLLAAVGLGLGPLLVPVSALASAPVPLAAPVGAAVTTAVAPGVHVDLEQIGPAALVPGSQLQVRVLVTNATSTPLEGARARLFVNSPVLADRAAVAAWAAGEGVQGGDRFASVDGSEIPLDVDLAPGESTEVAFSVSADQLRLGEEFGARGVTVDVLDASLQRLDALRTFLVWMPQGAPPASTGLTVLAPVVAGALDVGTGQLPADAVEPQVATDGRLSRVVGSVTTPATSLVVDPAVLGPYAVPAAGQVAEGATASPSSSATPSGSGIATATDSPSASSTATPSPTATPVAGGEDDASTAARSWRTRLLALAAPGLAALPQGDADVAGTVAAGTSDLLSLAVEQSTAATTAATGTAPSAELLWPATPVPATQLVLAAAGAAQGGRTPVVVLDSTAVQGAVSQQGTSPATTTATAQAPDGSVVSAQAVLVDSGASALLASATQRAETADTGSGTATATSATDPAEVGAQLLADTAVAVSVGAAAGQEQGLVMALPRDWDPDPGAVSAVLSPLGSVPWVRSTPLVDLLVSTPPTALPAADASTPAVTPDTGPLPADGLQTAQGVLGAVRAAGSLVEDAPALEAPVETSAVAAASAAWVEQQDAWRTQLAALAQRRDQLQGAVAVVSGSPLVVVNKVVSLPVTIRNDLPQNARVWVSVRSTSFRLQPGQPQEVVVPAGGTQQALLPVRAVSSGDLTLYVNMTDEAGQTVGSEAALPVQVRADWESRGVAIAVAVIVIVFVGGVVRTVVRVRRRPAPPVVRSAEEADGDGPPARRPEESTRG